MEARERQDASAEGEKVYPPVRDFEARQGWTLNGDAVCLTWGKKPQVLFM